jgi:hypothetical protein
VGFTLPPQKKVHVERATGAEVDIGAALEFFYFQGGNSFPRDDVFPSGKY